MYSVTEAAKLMGISTGRVRQLLGQGRIKAKKLGHDWVVLELGYTLNRDYPGKGRKGQKHAKKGGQDNEKC